MKTTLQSMIPKYSILSIVTLAGCLGLGTGCQVHRNLRLEYTVGEAGVLRTVPSTKLFLEVIDERPADERDRVAKVAKVIYVVEGGLVPKVESALRAELEKAGHPVVTAGAGGAQVTIRVVLQRFWAGYRETGGGFALEKYAEINAKVTASRTGPAPKAVTFSVSTRESKVFPLAAPGGVAMVADPAFNEFVRTVTAHPELVAALKSAQSIRP